MFSDELYFKNTHLCMHLIEACSKFVLTQGRKLKLFKMCVSCFSVNKYKSSNDDFYNSSSNDKLYYRTTLLSKWSAM